jgi:plasmid replication initiation protein
LEKLAAQFCSSTPEIHEEIKEAIPVLFAKAIFQICKEANLQPKLLD